MPVVRLHLKSECRLLYEGCCGMEAVVRLTLNNNRHRATEEEKAYRLTFRSFMLNYFNVHLQMFANKQVFGQHFTETKDSNALSFIPDFVYGMNSHF